MKTLTAGLYGLLFLSLLIARTHAGEPVDSLADALLANGHLEAAVVALQTAARKGRV